MLIFIPLVNIRKIQIFYVFREHKRKYEPKMGQATTILVSVAQFNLVLMPEITLV